MQRVDLNARIDSKELKKITDKIPETKATLDSSEVIQGNELLELFECIICKGIPISPRECN
jgi:hypothetical protein